MATVHAANVDLEFDLCGAERDHNAGRMCDPPDERVRRVEMGRIPKKGGNSVMLIMEEQSEDSESEVRIYLRKKRETGETVSSSLGLSRYTHQLCAETRPKSLVLCLQCGVPRKLFQQAHHVGLLFPLLLRFRSAPVGLCLLHGPGASPTTSPAQNH